MQTPTDMESQPFLYAIGWTALDKWYVGCRYAKGCKPADLWTNYFTSSRFVKEFREQNGEPDHVEILFTDTKENVLAKEEEALREWAMHRDERFLNRGIGGVSFTRPDDWHAGNPQYENWRKSIVGVMRSPETRAKIAELRRGRKHSEETKAKMRLAKLAGPSDEARAKMSLAKLNNQNARKGPTKTNWS